MNTNDISKAVRDLEQEMRGLAAQSMRYDVQNASVKSMSTDIIEVNAAKRDGDYSTAPTIWMHFWLDPDDSEVDASDVMANMWMEIIEAPSYLMSFYIDQVINLFPATSGGYNLAIGQMADPEHPTLRFRMHATSLTNGTIRYDYNRR